MREATITRKTTETDIALTVGLDGTGTARINTGCGFLDHMLTAFGKHARFDLSVTCKGDTQVDYHHTTEDLGIALGQAFKEALGDMRGINRFGYFTMVMDEAMIIAAVDISGRSLLNYDVALPAARVGDFDTELAEELFLGLCRHLGLTLHIKQMAGANSHHILKAMFKGVGKALAMAIQIDPRFKDDIPSTKGML